MSSSRIQRLAWVVGALLAAMLTACAPKTVITSYEAYNHTSRSIVSIIVNGEGGILNASAYGGSGEMCCVVLPARWRPGLEVTVKWQYDGDWLLDGHGKPVIEDGKKVYVPRPYKEKTVDIPEYASGDQMGRLHIHFFPNDEVKVIVFPFGPGGPDYPYPLPHVPSAPKEG